MITLYSGTPGSGKSLDIARLIYLSLNSRYPRHILSNIEIDSSLVKHSDFFEYCPNDRLTCNYIVDYCKKIVPDLKRKKEGSIILIIDEAQLLFNARTWQLNDNKGWIEFFTQHRKYLVDVILVAQFDRMLDRQIRSLIEYEVVHRKVTNFGKFGIFIRLFLFGKDLFIANKVWYPLKERLSSEFFTARKKYYRLYDTYQIWKKT